jgi:hypothetical protein
MDMVAIVSEHNSRLDILTGLEEGTIVDMEKIYLALKDHERKLNLLKDNFIEEDVAQFLHAGYGRPKKEPLN